MVVKNKGGRPTKINDEILGKLIDIFKIDGTVEEACSYAGICPDTYYRNMKNNKRFSEKISEAKYFKFIYAKQKLFKSMDSKNDAVSQKGALEFLSRRHPDYKDKKNDITINNTPRFSSIKIIDATTGGKSSTNSGTNGETANPSE